MLTSNSELAKELLQQVARLADLGSAREAIWVVVGACQDLEGDWIFEPDIVRLVTMGARMSVVESPPSYASAEFFKDLLDKVLFAATGGVPIVTTQLLDDMNTARILIGQLLADVRTLGLTLL